jgi:hypothetical protein
MEQRSSLSSHGFTFNSARVLVLCKSPRPSSSRLKGINLEDGKTELPKMFENQKVL